MHELWLYPHAIGAEGMSTNLECVWNGWTHQQIYTYIDGTLRIARHWSYAYCRWSEWYVLIGMEGCYGA